MSADTGLTTTQSRKPDFCNKWLDDTDILSGVSNLDRWKASLGTAMWEHAERIEDVLQGTVDIEDRIGDISKGASCN
jgi:hypothetical protein